MPGVGTVALLLSARREKGQRCRKQTIGGIEGWKDEGFALEMGSA